MQDIEKTARFHLRIAALFGGLAIFMLGISVITTITGLLNRDPASAHIGYLETIPMGLAALVAIRTFGNFLIHQGEAQSRRLSERINMRAEVAGRFD